MLMLNLKIYSKNGLDTLEMGTGDSTQCSSNGIKIDTK